MLKRILLITENLGSGGAERQITGLAVLLTEAGYVCRLITYVENQFYEPYLRDNGVDYEFVSELWNKKTRVFKTARYIRKYNPDVIISYLPSVNMTMCLAKLFHPCKLIVSERNNNICVKTRDKILFNLYRLADCIVPNSQSQGMFIKKNFPFLSSKVHPIINFVDVNRFKPSANPSYNDKLRIITVARYTSQKNVLTYLKAVRLIKDKGLNVHFDWYGDKSFNKPYFEQVQREYDMLNLSDYLILHESCQSIEQEYQKSDVFLLPSLYEGYPNVVVEAMACGLPIVCSDCYENPFIVKEGTNGFLFNPERVEEMVFAIEKVVCLSNEERIFMGMRNRELCLKRNGKDSFVKSYINLIESF